MKKRGKLIKLPPPDKSYKYCKFDLFTDQLIGLGNIQDVIDDNQEAIIEAQQDEDYLTDAGVLRNTKKLCKRDLLETYRSISDDQRLTEKGTRNYKY